MAQPPYPWVTVSPRTLTRSHVAERKAYANVGAGVQPGAQEITIANIDAEDGEARPWRVFLGRLDRTDQHAPLNQGAGDPFQSVPVWQSQLYPYAAGLQNLPAIPPRRSNPVWGLNYPFNAASLTPVPFVEISWGMKGAAAQRIIAHWPAQGASIVVTGSYVQVWAGVALYNAGGQPEFSIPVNPSEWPVFQAQITPESSLAPRDAAELSLTQRTTVAPFQAAVPESPAVARTADFGVGIFLSETPDGSGPFHDLDATFEAPASFDGRTLVIQQIGSSVPPGVSSFEFRTDQRPFVTSATSPIQWDPAPNTLGLGFQSTGGTLFTVADMIAWFAGIGITMVTAQNPAWVFVGRRPSDADPFAASSVFAGGVPAVPARWGGAVYVPDFARRVRVVLAEQPQCDGEPVLPGIDIPMIPFAGDPTAQIVWFDDAGNVIDAAIQGQGVSTPVQWHPVPAGATMLGVYTDPCESGGNLTVTYTSVFDPENHGVQADWNPETCRLEIVQTNEGIPGDAIPPTVADLVAALALAGWTYAPNVDPQSFLQSENNGEAIGLACEGWDFGEIEPNINTADEALTGPVTADTAVCQCGAGYEGLIHWRIAP